MDVDIPEPNEALAAVLISPKMRAIVEERANTAAMLYQAEVAKRTGRLAASAHAHAEVGGKHKDRWIGELTVAAPYTASHEFGTHKSDAAHDLNRVLEQLGHI